MTEAVLARNAPVGPAPPIVQPVAARVDDEWISLAASLPPRTGAVAPWQALLQNAQLVGLARLVLRHGGREFEIRADCPVDDGVDVDSRLREAQASVRQAGSGTRPAGEIPEPDTVDLGVVAEEAGWAFVRRSSGRMVVDLGVPDQFCQAVIEPHGAGCRARVVLAMAVNPSAIVRSALAVLLLTVTASVRMVRAGATEREGQTAVFVETGVAAPVSARELHHALAALAVTCRMAGREAKALVDDRVAGLYVTARGWAACP